MASATVCGVRPPESMKGMDGSSALSSDQSKVSPNPPGRSAPLGGLASSRMRSATSTKSATWATSSAEPMGRCLHDLDARLGADGLHAMRRLGAMQLDPVRAERRDFGDAAIVGIDQHHAGLDAAARLRNQRRRSARSVTWRGERGKCMKPTMSAPAAMVASSMGEVLMPQILMIRGRPWVAQRSSSRSSTSAVGDRAGAGPCGGLFELAIEQVWASRRQCFSRRRCRPWANQVAVPPSRTPTSSTT